MALHLGTSSVAPVGLGDRFSEASRLWSKGECLGLTRLHQTRWRPPIARAGRIERGMRASLAQTVSAQVPDRVVTPAAVTWIATITVVRKTWGNPLSPLLEALEDSLLKRHVELELISEKLDPATGRGKTSQPSNLTNFGNIFRGGQVQYTAELSVDYNFGSPAAITVLNNHSNELYVETISLESPLTSKPIYFKAESHVHTTNNSPEKRVFFRNNSYLPKDTPAGIRDWREKDLQSLRGDGTGQRHYWERVYDYDVYNDLGHIDLWDTLKRPVLGGNPELPYPRRLRTGRPKSKKDPSQEAQTFFIFKNYVPRDESFSATKTWDFLTSSFKGVFLAIIPFLETSFTDTPTEFDRIDDIDALYTKQNAAPNGLVSKFQKAITSFLRYPSPRLLEGDKLRWFRDEEFGRQILAGMNPTAVERLRIFPPESALDEATYGPKRSTITTQDFEKNLQGLTVEQAMEQKRLYIVDYHDGMLPLVNTFAALGDGRKLYAPRVILFYTLERVFKPVAIELSLPPSENRTETKSRVFTPGTDVTTSWLWLFAKIHFNVVDLGFHELYTHWLRGHASAEPYIIASHRHLSSLHPVMKLLHPHLRYTIEINAIGRKTLIAPAGIIEQCQFPGLHAMVVSSLLYSFLWRFDTQSLPGDLIARGMAEEDPTAPQGLKLAIEDYPHAADGLSLWTAIQTFVEEYLSIYYIDSSQVQDDTELQAWWHEIRTEGHKDKKDEPWWPSLQTKDDLVRVLCTIIWTCSCHHAAANFGQYTYAGYMPNRPVHARRFIPEEGEPEWEEFLKDPDLFLLSMLPDQPASTVQMLVTASLATHSRDEEYIGHRRPHWTGDERALKAFEKFSKAIDGAQEEIDRRNRNPELKLRHGAAIIPYHLLYPTSEPGITGRGVPNSITI